MLQSAPKQVFFIIKIEKFCAEAAEPPTLAAAGHSFLHLVCGASIFAPSAVTHTPLVGSLATGLCVSNVSTIIYMLKHNICKI